MSKHTNHFFPETNSIHVQFCKHYHLSIVSDLHLPTVAVQKLLLSADAQAVV